MANNLHKDWPMKKGKGGTQMRRMLVVLLAVLSLMALTMGMAAAERGPIFPATMSASATK